MIARSASSTARRRRTRGEICRYVVAEAPGRWLIHQPQQNGAPARPSSMDEGFFVPEAIGWAAGMEERHSSRLKAGTDHLEEGTNFTKRKHTGPEQSVDADIFERPRPRSSDRRNAEF